jgi:phospho-N-acetylmuramoyl-pentapeptide-transferase
MFLLGAPLIRWLRRKRWKKDALSDAEAWQVREDTPETHQKKQGTPSMGGIGIIGVACAVFGACVFADRALDTIRTGGRISLWYSPYLFVLFWFPVFVAAHALLGFADDWSKASGRGGLRARAKFLGQLILASGFVLVFAGLVAAWFDGDNRDNNYIWGQNSIDTLLLYKDVLLLIVLIGTCNAVNLTDGIDGLAAGLAVQIGLSLALIGEPYSAFGDYAILFWAALAGSCLGFLCYNKYPAKVFMGDTGSLALGAAVGAGAIMTHSVFLLPFIAFIYFVEAGSVTLQVLYFKYTRRKYGEGRRIFRRAPLHHHFELGGWSEWRVVGTFWTINLVTSVIGLILWHLNILPRFP